MFKRVNISIDEDVLSEFDKMIGLVKRSTYIADMISKEVSRLELKNNQGGEIKK